MRPTFTCNVEERFYNFLDKTAAKTETHQDFIEIFTHIKRVSRQWKHDKTNANIWSFAAGPYLIQRAFLRGDGLKRGGLKDQYIHRVRIDQMLATQAAGACLFKEFGAGGHPPCGWASALAFTNHSIENINEQEATQFYNIFAATCSDAARAAVQNTGFVVDGTLKSESARRLLGKFVL
jgi:hypothetical protein